MCATLMVHRSEKDCDNSPHSVFPTSTGYSHATAVRDDQGGADDKRAANDRSWSSRLPKDQDPQQRPHKRLEIQEDPGA